MRECNVLEAEESFKQEDGVYNVRIAEKPGEDGSMPVRCINAEATGDFRAERAISVAQWGRSHTAKC